MIPPICLENKHGKHINFVYSLTGEAAYPQMDVFDSICFWSYRTRIIPPTDLLSFYLIRHNIFLIFHICNCIIISSMCIFILFLCVWPRVWNTHWPLWDISRCKSHVLIFILIMLSIWRRVESWNTHCPLWDISRFKSDVLIFIFDLV